MLSKYDTIDKIIKYRDSCVFCGSKLRVSLTNSISFKDCLSTLNSNYKNGSFNFKIIYNSATSNLKAEAKIDAFKNILIFDKPIQSTYGDADKASQMKLCRQAAWVFDKLAAHIESYCPNQKCGLNYHFWSNMFNVINTGDTNFTQYLIAPIHLFVECFTTDGFFVQNDLTRNKTNIYSVSDDKKNPVTMDLISFDMLDKDKISNKIKMITIFS